MIFNLFEFLNIFLTYLIYLAVIKYCLLLSTILFVIELLEQLIEILLFIVFAV